MQILHKLLTTRTIYILIILFSIFTNFYHLEKTHLFEWDQERDAEVVYERIIKEKKPTLLGSRAVGPEGFFVGPLHYYILAPFYGATKGDPIAAPIAAGLLGVLTTASYTWVAHKLFNRKAAFIAGLLSALLPQLTAWNVMYMPLLTVFMYYACHQILEKKYRFIPWAFFIVALGFQAHSSVAYLLIQLLIVLGLLINREKSIKKMSRNIVSGLAILILSFAPLILFDVRHDFLNTKLFMQFLQSNTAKEAIDFTRAFTIFIRNPNVLSFLHNKTILAYVNVGMILVSLIAAHRHFTSNKNQLINVFTWIFIPLITLSLYSGTISEYYFVTVTSLTLLFTGVFIAGMWERSQFTRILVFVVLAFVTYGNIKPILARDDLSSMYYKKALVKYIADQKDPYFSLSYKVPLGRGFGFGYLLRYYDIQPDDTKPIPKYFLRIEPEEKEHDLPEEVFGIYKLSKRVEE